MLEKRSREVARFSVFLARFSGLGVGSGVWYTRLNDEMLPNPMIDTLKESVQGTELGRSAVALELGSIIARFADSDGAHRTAIEGLSFHRWSRPTGLSCGSYGPALSFVAQGSKRVRLGAEKHDYDDDHYLLVSFDLPLMWEIRRATREAPFLCLTLDLDLRSIADLVLHTDDLPREVPPQSGLAVGRLTAPLGDSLVRLARLLETPRDISVVAPLVQREVLYRLLVGEQGARLRHLIAPNSQSRHIARAIEWVRANYMQPLSIDELANIAAMSVSTFHYHFKAITALSPLQYQKQLRLQEARRLMLVEAIDAASAGHRVGYDSASQFSREYGRFFGAPPRRDLALVRGRPHGDTALQPF
jgi:AraC-like DNA-binding protein